MLRSLAVVWLLLRQIALSQHQAASPKHQTPPETRPADATATAAAAAFGLNPDECLEGRYIAQGCFEKAAEHLDQALEALSEKNICRKSCEYLAHPLSRESFLSEFGAYFNTFVNFLARKQDSTQAVAKEFPKEIPALAPLKKSVVEALEKWSELELSKLYDISRNKSVAPECAEKCAEEFLASKAANDRGSNAVVERKHSEGEFVNETYDENDKEMLRLLADGNAYMNSTVKKLLLDYIKNRKIESEASQSGNLLSGDAEYLEKVAQSIALSRRNSQSCKNLFRILGDTLLPIGDNPEKVLKVLIKFCAEGSAGKIIDASSASLPNGTSLPRTRLFSKHSAPLLLEVRLGDSEERKFAVAILNLLKRLSSKGLGAREASNKPAERRATSLEEVFLESWREAKSKVFGKHRKI